MVQKTACVVQGNVRKGLHEILDELQRHFDLVILSTWKNKTEDLPTGKYELLLSDEPPERGISNRNLQRYSTDIGLRCAESEGCTHVMKWRTDMLPTRLNIDELLRFSLYEVPPGVPSRIVTCAFRNLTVRPDYFSSIPDLFAFGEIGMMKMLWSADSFDFTKKFNVPSEMIGECGDEWLSRPDVSNIYFPEVELYAFFKNRLMARTKRSLDHTTIVKDYMYLVDHQRLGICWFDALNGFRSITQALQHPWWTERTWKRGKPVLVDVSYRYGAVRRIKGEIITPFVIKTEKMKQVRWYNAFTNKGHHD